MTLSDEQPESEEMSDSGDLAFVAPAKKSNQLSVIGFVAIVVVGGTFGIMRMRHGPKTASAAVQTAHADKTITQFLSGGSHNLAQMKAMLHNTEKQVHIFETYPSVHQVPLGNLKTNPFLYKSDELSAAEAARRLADQRAAIAKAAKELKLQSIMYSPTRGACMINNSLCSKGDKIGVFTVEKINPSSVIMGQGAARFELRIQR